jgi:hypothetical protein
MRFEVWTSAVPSRVFTSSPAPSDRVASPRVSTVYRTTDARLAKSMSSPRAPAILGSDCCATRSVSERVAEPPAAPRARITDGLPVVQVLEERKAVREEHDTLAAREITEPPDHELQAPESGFRQHRLTEVVDRLARRRAAARPRVRVDEVLALADRGERVDAHPVEGP